MSARSHLARVLLCLCAVVLAGCGGSPPAPSVLLVTLDTTRADALSCYGGSTRTPVLDGLAAAGVRFERAVASAALTPPAHATIMTGREPYEHGVRVLLAPGGVRLDPGVPTLAEVLRSQGYETAAFQSAFPVSAFYGLDRGFAVFDAVDAAVGSLGEGGGATWDSRRGQRRSDETTARALAWLETAEAPFLLWIHYWDPHDPQLVPPAGLLPPDLPRDADGRPAKGDALYAVEVAFVDRQIGRVLRALEERGLAGSTLVAVTADHGEGLEDGRARHGWRGHRILYEEQLRVPLLLRGPGLRAGALVGGLARAVDLAPTLLDYAGVEAPDCTGRSLRPLIEGREDAPRIAYAEALNRFDDNATQLLERRSGDDLVYAASDGRWKLLWRPTSPQRSELFDLRADPGEQRDLAREQWDQAARLLNELARREPWVLSSFEADISSDPGVAAVLAGLGYAGGGAAAAAPLSWRWVCALHARPLLDGGEGPAVGHGGCEGLGVPVGG